jgi:hypothetical protein
VIPVVCLTSVQLRDDASMTIVRNRLIRCVRHNFPLCSDPREANLHVHVGTPHVMPQTKTRRATAKFVFYTLAEASRVPGQWVEVLNKCDEVWTASRFSRDAFVNSGVTRPIHVIPLGIDCPREPLVRSREEGSAPFTVMWQGARQKAFHNSRPCDGDRKRGFLVETAFLNAKLPNSRLILKSLPLEGVSYDFRCGNVWYICKSFSPREIAALDAITDVFVWPTMGEGFGLPPLEKLSLGIPAFATFWSGPKDYQQDFPLKRLLPARLQTVRFNGALAEMADVDESSLIELMRDCYESRERLNELRPELFRIARRWDTDCVLKPALLAAIRRISHEANARQPSTTADQDLGALR